MKQCTQRRINMRAPVFPIQYLNAQFEIMASLKICREACFAFFFPVPRSSLHLNRCAITVNLPEKPQCHCTSNHTVGLGQKRLFISFFFNLVLVFVHVTFVAFLQPRKFDPINTGSNSISILAILPFISINSTRTTKCKIIQFLPFLSHSLYLFIVAFVSSFAHNYIELYDLN